MAHTTAATAVVPPPMTEPALAPATAAATATGYASPSHAQSQAHAHPQRPRNRIQVSREKRPLYFFIGLAKKFLTSEDEVELSGLGLAVTTVVTVAEILKNSGHVTISRIHTSLVEMPVEQRGGNANASTNAAATATANSDVRATTPKAKIQIWIRKSDQFDALTQYVDHAKKGTRRNDKQKNSNAHAQAPATPVLAPAAAVPNADSAGAAPAPVAANGSVNSNTTTPAE